MTQKKQQILLIILFSLGTIWNILCLFQIIPIHFVIISLSTVMLANVVNIIAACRTSKQEGQHEKRSTFSIILCPAAAWMSTYISCLVYSL